MWPLVIFSLFALAGGGIFIGALTGWLASLVLRNGPQSVLKNATLGLLGIFAGMIMTMAVLLQGQSRHYHAEYYFDGEKVVTKTTGGIQHPGLVGFAGAAGAMLLPILHEIYRLKKAHPHQ